MTDLDSLLAELSSLGWTISWAYQYGPSEWRMSIIHEDSVGKPQGTYTSHCAFAPTFAEALEDCIAKRNDAEFSPTTPQSFSIDNRPEASLVERLGLLRPAVPFARRF